MANFSLMMITCLFYFSLVWSFRHCFNPKKQLINVSKAYQTYSSYDSYSGNWAATGATWYGDSTGAGSDGGACGYADAVESATFDSLTTAVAPSLYNNGLGCGLCYQVKCTSSSSKYCSGHPVTVVVTDSCPGCDHLFDLSGASFGAMAIDGEAYNLRNAGRLKVLYMRVECDFRVDVTFVVQPGCNANYFAMSVEFENRYGVSGVSIMNANSDDDWIQMTLSWGAIYKVDFASGYPGPYSVQLTNGEQTIVAKNVIPANYVPGRAYISTVNFKV